MPTVTRTSVAAMVGAVTVASEFEVAVTAPVELVDRTATGPLARLLVQYVVHHSAADPPDRAAIRAAARQVTAALRQGYDDSRVNRAGARRQAELIASATP